MAQTTASFQSRLNSSICNLIVGYFETHGFARHHIESFDYFVDNLVPMIISELGTLSCHVKTGGTHRVVFSDPVFESPTVRNSDHYIYPLYPNEALQRKLTYGLTLYVNVSHVFSDAAGNKIFSRHYLHHPICSIPCMIGSKYCYMSQRQPEIFCSPDVMRSVTLGYFIVSGQEKVLISQETMRTNWPCCSLTEKAARCEVRSLNSGRMRSTSTIYLHVSRNSRRGIALLVSIPFVSTMIDLYIVFAALGVSDVEKILVLCGGPKTSELIGPIVAAQREAFVRHCEKNFPDLSVDSKAIDTRMAQMAMRYISQCNSPSESVAPSDIPDPKLETDKNVPNDDFTNLEVDQTGDIEPDEGELDAQEPEPMPAKIPERDVGASKKESGQATGVESAVRQIQHIFDVEVFPHIGLDSCNARHKANYLGFCIRKLILVFQGEVPPDDRDHYMNKRVQPAGVLLAVLFRQIFRRMLNQLSLHLSKLPLNRVDFEHLINYCELKQISASLRYSLATGNWGIMKAGCSVVGVSQALCRDRIGTISQLRRTNTNLNRDGKQPRPRQLYENQWSIICPCETPEGKSCGLVKAMALLAVTQTSLSSTELIVSLRRFVSPRLLLPDEIGAVIVFVCGEIIGTTNDSKALCSAVRKLKHRNVLPFLVSVSYDESGVNLNCDSGILSRPVFHLPRLLQELAGEPANWNTPGSWEDLQRRGIVVYMDKAEDRHKFISPNIFQAIEEFRAWNPASGTARRPAKYAEIYPTSIMGIPAMLIPFSDKNQAPRNIYSTCMTKQAMGMPNIDFHNRCDPTTYVLSYPQKPIVSTLGDRIACTTELPTGINAVVLIAMYDGWNIEDALVIKRSAVDRGLFDLNIYRTYTDEISPNQNEGQSFGIPQTANAQGLRALNYSTLESDGLPAPGTRLRHGDPVIGKTVTLDTNWSTENKERSTIDKSVTAKHQNDCATVVSCRLSTTPNKNCIAHVTTVTRRKVHVGDKFASRHAQKGVCSIIADEIDMPFSVVDGMVPDLIISPCALPSRMTIGQLQESIFGKNAALAGEIADGTPFIDQDVDAVRQALRRQGFSGNGAQRFRCGKTGKELVGELFMGVVYYQRLKHMVCDKLHARATGPVHDLTRQPPHGRGRNGGFRLGEMERDAMIAHGGAGFLTDRYLYNSDRFDTVICKKCGQFAIPARPSDAKYTFSAGTAYCRLCSSAEHVVPVVLPYCMKLLVQELQAMNIFVDMHIT